MVTLGILCGVALGAIAFILFRGRRELSGSNQLELDGLGWSPDDEFGPPRARKSLPAPPKLPKPIRTVGSRPVARTVRVSGSTPTLLLKAVGRRNWTVWVRVVDPAGSFATFFISNNSGDSIEIPAGGFHQMQIPSGEFLYAKGDQDGVTVSVSGGEA